MYKSYMLLLILVSVVIPCNFSGVANIGSSVGERLKQSSTPSDLYSESTWLVIQSL